MTVSEIQVGRYYMAERPIPTDFVARAFFKCKSVSESGIVTTDGSFKVKRNYDFSNQGNTPLEDFSNVEVFEETEQSWGNWEFVEITKEEFDA